VTPSTGSPGGRERTAYLAAEGFLDQLVEELQLARIPIAFEHGDLLVTERPAIRAAWALNTWFNCEQIPITSISDASTKLRSLQRNWAVYAPEHRGRADLITRKLPYVSAKPLPFGQPAPTAPLGSWTLLAPSLVLAAAHCSSPFANGAPQFIEDHEGPPNRAYLKLWEALCLLRKFPKHGERCLDLGASPGGWTWSLAQTGATVLAYDKAPLDPYVDALPNVTWFGGSAFGLEPKDVGPVDWWCSDIIGYPERVLRLVEKWLDHAANIICTIKFQGGTDHEVAHRFAAIPHSRVVHLFNNKHELTFLRPGPTLP
jgi:23S rRNA (cytidine2498-2'-O)-methyltransferase